MRLEIVKGEREMTTSSLFITSDLINWSVNQLLQTCQTANSQTANLQTVNKKLLSRMVLKFIFTKKQKNQEK